MRFDAISFILGFGIAAFIAFMLFRSRARIAAVQQVAESQAKVKAGQAFLGGAVDLALGAALFL